MLGQTVTVTVDRPLGSFHPNHPDIYYSVNYGYVKGTIAPDGEEQDAYILGIDKPIKEFTGRVIAVIIRKNDIENKWVVAPEGMIFTEKYIRISTHFQEQFFQTTIEIYKDR